MQSWVQGRTRQADQNNPVASRPEAKNSLEDLKLPLERKGSKERRKEHVPPVEASEALVSQKNDKNASQTSFAEDQAQRQALEDNLILPRRGQTAESKAIHESATTISGDELLPSVSRPGQDGARQDRPNHTQSLLADLPPADSARDADDERIEIAKRRKLTAARASGLATSYIKGDSYADTTSGRLSQTDIDATARAVVPGGAQTSQLPTPVRGPLDIQQEQERAAVTRIKTIPVTKQTSKLARNSPVASTLATAQPKHTRFANAPENDLYATQAWQPVAVGGYGVTTAQQQAQPRLLQGFMPHAPVKPGESPPIPLPSFTETARVYRDGSRQLNKPFSPPHELIPNTRTSESVLPDQITSIEGPNKESELELEQLYSQDYATLQAETFDDKPIEDPLDIALRAPAKIGGIDQLLLLDRDGQDKHFRSLSIDEWEMTGKWFIQRFSETYSSITAVRRKRREAALLLEAELDQRHRFVTKKRKLTEKSLVEMRSQGTQVLANTPRKTPS